MIEQRKKAVYMALMIGILALAMTFGCTDTRANASRAADDAVTAEGALIDSEEIVAMSGASLAEAYGQYGLTYDASQEAVYFNGERVRQFVDGGAYYHGGGYWCDFFYSDEAGQGIVYLHAVRNGRGSIAGLETMTEHMLNDLYGQAQPLSKKPELSPHICLEEACAAFSDYGLAYDQAEDQMQYQGEPVKAFVDGGSKYSEGGYWFNMTYFNKDVSSSLYLISVRDQSGAVIGLEEMPQQLKEAYYGANGVLKDQSSR